MSDSITHFEETGMPGFNLNNSGAISYDILDKAKLYSAYMQFVKNGGLFITSDLRYNLGDEVSVSLQLMDEEPKILIKGKVVWITPSHAQGNKAQGIGIQFNEEDAEGIRNKIETYLAGALQSDRPTSTL